MRYIGIDYGTKRIGIALSDEDARIAFPHSVIDNNRKALGHIAELVRENNVDGLVVGDSRNFKNEPNAVAEAAEEFTKDLAALTKLTNVEYEPEFFSSAMAAHQYTPDGSRKQAPSQEMLDASAAAIILQSYIDRLKTS